jgi:transposase-like protein
MSGFKIGGSYGKAYTAAFKAQIVQEVLKEEKTVVQLAAEHHRN